MLFYVLAILFCIFVIYWVFIHDGRYDKTVKKPYFEWPLIGNLPHLLYQSVTNTILVEYEDKVRQYGKYYMVLPEEYQLNFSDPPSIKFVLDDPKTFILPAIRKKLYAELFGNGIFIANGESWSVQRDLAKPIFHVNTRANMFEVYHKCANDLLSVLNDHSCTQKPLEIVSLFKRFTLDTFSEIAFGYPTNSLLCPVPFCAAFDYVVFEVDARYKNPARYISGSFFYYKNLKIVEEFVYKLIKDRKKEGDYQGKTDFLSFLLDLEDKGEATGVTPQFLKDQLMNFLIAGRDTTAVLISWALYLMAKHPAVERKVRQEIEKVVGNAKVNREHTANLKYLQMVLDETLRLYPPAVPISARTATKDVTLPNGARVPAGGTLAYSVFVTHRLPEYWGNDAEEFKPDRWKTDAVKKHAYQFVPFQKGPRICLGMNMAYEEAKCCLVIMFQNGFHFQLDPKHVVTYSVAPILAPNGVIATVHKDKRRIGKNNKKTK